MRERTVYASNIAYLDPASCGSSIGFSVVRRTGRRARVRGAVYGTVNLSDCNRLIEWYFNGRNALKKIDKAIAVLAEFRSALVSASKKPKRRS